MSTDQGSFLPTVIATNIRSDLFALALTALGLLATGTVQAQGERSVKDGVYTADQADRGKKEYRRQCASCHAVDLRGGDRVQPLVGEEFLNKWAGATLWQFADLTAATMPLGVSRQLTEDELESLVAYILQENNYTGGKTALEIRIDRPIIIEIK